MTAEMEVLRFDANFHIADSQNVDTQTVDTKM
jgi:hypothetical protein